MNSGNIRKFVIFLSFFIYLISPFVLVIINHRCCKQNVLSHFFFMFCYFTVFKTNESRLFFLLSMKNTFKIMGAPVYCDFNYMSKICKIYLSKKMHHAEYLASFLSFFVLPGHFLFPKFRIYFTQNYKSE